MRPVLKWLSLLVLAFLLVYIMVIGLFAINEWMTA